MDIIGAKKLAAKWIGFKMYTCHEIYKKLIQKGCEEDIAETVVAEFSKAGILNDEEYAKLYIHDAAVIGLKGIYRIKQELHLKGIASSVIEKAISSSPLDMEAKLKEYIELRFGSKEFSDYKELEKAKAHLLRRGFSISDINRCFRELNIKIVRGEDD